MSVRVLRGLPPALRPDAAALYWEAFGSKLGAVLGPQAKALEFLEHALQPDHAYVALDTEGALLGLIGFKSPQGSFAGGSFEQMCAVYGRFGALWRAGLLALLQQDTENQRFLIDGVCVTRAKRGNGIGTALMEALFQEAAARRYQSIRLEVVEGNWRARALYERLGFLPVHTERMGLVRHVFGFAACTTMVRPL
jgi:ribosomal protein S18 acetylase RimI-like enzyme